MSYININNNELKRLIEKEDTILIDIRTEEEYEEINIEKSINIPLNKLLYSLDELQEYKDKNIIIYCRSGHRSVTACNLLYIEGFKNLYNLENGIIDYKL